ncbi:MAG: hypothetical protein K0S45_2473 [Nitrospira sp.]|jgi:hypothetical protein|nr:hypothetical protein [Nitrospira sp.]
MEKTFAVAYINPLQYGGKANLRRSVKLRFVIQSPGSHGKIGRVSSASNCLAADCTEQQTPDVTIVP